MALGIVNVVVVWMAMAFLPKDNASYTAQSAFERKIEIFFSTKDWSMIFTIVGMSVFLTIALWLILSSYDSLPDGDMPRSLKGNDEA